MKITERALPKPARGTASVDPSRASAANGARQPAPANPPMRSHSRRVSLPGRPCVVKKRIKALPVLVGGRVGPASLRAPAHQRTSSKFQVQSLNLESTSCYLGTLNMEL